MQICWLVDSTHSLSLFGWRSLAVDLYRRLLAFVGDREVAAAEFGGSFGHLFEKAMFHELHLTGMHRYFWQRSSSDVTPRLDFAFACVTLLRGVSPVVTMTLHVTRRTPTWTRSCSWPRPRWAWRTQTNPSPSTRRWASSSGGCRPRTRLSSHSPVSGAGLGGVWVQRVCVWNCVFEDVHGGGGMGGGVYCAVQWSWFARVNALWNLLPEVAASLPGQFLSRRCFTLCITMEGEPRIAKQYTCHHYCSCKNYRGWRVEKNVFVLFFGRPEDHESVKKCNKLLLVARHILTTGLQKCL